MKVTATVEVRLKGAIGIFEPRRFSVRCYHNEDPQDCILMACRRQGFEPNVIRCIVCHPETPEPEPPSQHGPMDTFQGPLE